MAAKLKISRTTRDMLVDRFTETLTIATQAKDNVDLQNIFKARYRRLDDSLAQFQEVHLDIIHNLASRDENPSADNEIRKEVDVMYFQIVALYNELFPEIPNVELSRCSSVQSVPSTPQVKLPKINLPQFTGNLKDWPSFRDLFKSLIHDNSNLSPVEKFQYLLSCLSQEPLKLAKTLPMTAVNYSIVYKSLSDRYDNQRALATYFWKQITSLSFVNDDSSAKILRHFVDTFDENLEALKGLGLPVKEWDFVLLNIILDKLDVNIRRQFEEKCDKTKIPSFDSLKTFLQSYSQALEAVSLHTRNNHKSVVAKNKPVTHSDQQPYKPKSAFLVNTANTSNSCLLCKRQHPLFKCEQFIKNSVQERFRFAKANKLCLNCLRENHTANKCSSSHCRQCSEKHHTLLHFKKDSRPPETLVVTSPETTPTVASFDSTVTTMTSTVSATTVLLATAIVDILDVIGNSHRVRVLLDSGSQASFITEACCKLLNLSRRQLTIPIHGLGQSSSTTSRGVATCTLRPVAKLNPTLDVEVIVIPKICGDMPSRRIKLDNWKHLSNLALADPSFHNPAAIDILLGADVFTNILTGQKIVGAQDQPVAFDTIFGWVLMGKTNCGSASLHSFFINVDDTLNSNMKRFWELEDIPLPNPLTPDEIQCEKLFVETTQREPSGRYVVSLPFKDGPPKFHNSRSLAVRRFLSLEKRLLRDPELSRMYGQFMRDYLEKGHMEPVSEIASNTGYYIPHHCVIKPESSTTKLRVVFDASAKLPDQQSLNDTLLIGPKLQNDLFAVLTKFRFHNVVFAADIKQMYRQILLAVPDREFQRIVYRFHPEDPLIDYRLNTVTYGVSSAPVLAIRTLQQLARDERVNFPLAAPVLENDIYVDDIVSGSDSVSQALILQRQLNQLLKAGQFELRKWASNCPLLVESVPPDCRQESLSFDQDSESFVKILGLRWLPCQDVFSYTVQGLERPCTKRTILSEIARMFDPLGLLTPVSFFAKYLIQRLWCAGLDWDERPPHEIVTVWKQFQSELPLLASLQVNRRVFVEEMTSCELHAFCDASERGYAAAIYTRVVNSQGSVKVFLVCAKSKVAPLKKLSIPRLELCAAQLLSKLLHKVLLVFANLIQFQKIYAWSDSSIVLAWLKSPSYCWKTFVSNRVSLIQNTEFDIVWRHVPSKLNPADCASRGVLPGELINHPLWFCGPEFLYGSSDLWPVNKLPETDQEKRKLALIATVTTTLFSYLLNKYSSLAKIQRIIAYVYRFIAYCRRPRQERHRPLIASELHAALMNLVKEVQHSMFASDIRCLENKKLCAKPLRALKPFLDEDGVVRVGGRLAYSNLTFSKKHPAILPQRHRLTELIILQLHNNHLHVGVKTLQYLAQENFWILSAPRAIRHYLAKCIRCFRVKPLSLTPPMGNLPLERVSQVKPFSSVGIDFAGPISIKINRVRGVVPTKAYICLFICLATRAIHLEVVSNLSSEAFLAALRRFISRRGRCSTIRSDCGTNFVGAWRILKNFMEQAAQTESIAWNFNPPSAPHFGGIFEAGIKSFKTHFVRVIGDQLLTYEELTTVTTQIEAVLNSRPLCPVSSDPNDISALSPGHFLTLEPLSCIPDPDLTNLKLNRLDRWQLLQRIHQDFWKRWHREYLSTLQLRQKWHKPIKSVQIGTLVLIKNEQVPPLQWRLGRVVQVHPGADGIIRVVTVRTSQGLFQRPVVKLCPLPNQ